MHTLVHIIESFILPWLKQTSTMHGWLAFSHSMLGFSLQSGKYTQENPSYFETELNHSFITSWVGLDPSQAETTSSQISKGVWDEMNTPMEVGLSIVNSSLSLIPFGPVSITFSFILFYLQGV